MLPVAILAGGLATRLRPITEKIPKALVEVADRPFLAHQLELLKREGIEQVVLCVGHLGEQVQSAFGDGSQLGVRVDYSFDGPRLLGTAGAIHRALPKLGPEFFVLYGDSYLPVNFRAVAETFRSSGKPALMTVFANEGRWDTSNVWFEAGAIKRYDKQARLPQMRHIDYGLTVFKAEVFRDLPEEQPADLARILRDLAARGQLAGYEALHRFYEIGSPAGLAELDKLLREGKLPAE